MPDVYRRTDPEIPCRRHPDVAAETSCTRCGALLCDGCRVFVRGTQTCVSCRARSRFSPATLVWTFIGVAGVICLFAAVTKRSLMEMSTPSPVTTTLESPAMALSLESPVIHGEAPRCVGDDCFYPLRVVF